MKLPVAQELLNFPPLKLQTVARPFFPLSFLFSAYDSWTDSSTSAVTQPTSTSEPTLLQDTSSVDPGNTTPLLLGILIPLICVLLLVILILGFLFWRKRKAEETVSEEMDILDNIELPVVGLDAALETLEQVQYCFVSTHNEVTDFGAFRICKSFSYSDASN